MSQTNYTAGTASLSCVVGGLPVVSIVWLKDSLLFSGTASVMISTTMTSTPTSGQARSMLTFTNLTLSDAAQYQCVGNNTGAPSVEFTVTSSPATLTVLCKIFTTLNIVYLIACLSLRPTISDSNSTQSGGQHDRHCQHHLQCVCSPSSHHHLD